MSNQYSEDRLIEQTSIDIFKNQLGWDTLNVFQGERFGTDRTLGRLSEADVLLKRDVLHALTRLYPQLPEQAYEAAYDILAETFSTKPLADINKEKHQYLKDGIPVTFKNDRGEVVRNKSLASFAKCKKL